MARTRQTARRSTGGKAPRRQLATKAARGRNRPGKRRKRATQTNARALFGSGSFGAQVSSGDESEEQEEEEEEVTLEVCYESSFYAHHFDTGDRPAQVEGMFQHSFSIARTKSPDQMWLGWHLSSKYDGEGMKRHGRPSLNLVCALDISGSMGWSLSGGYGGGWGLNPQRAENKIQLAKKSLAAMIDQLQANDRFGLIVFNQDAHTLIPMKKWSEHKKTSVIARINKLRANGGTNITTAVQACAEMLKGVDEQADGSSRVLFLTDMEVGHADGESFTEHVKENAESGLFSTVTGIGLDLKQDVIDRVSLTEGCNYCNVLNAADFKRQMDTEFGHIVTPVAFNVRLKLKSKEHTLSKGYGSPEINNMKPGDPVAISTVFPVLCDAQNHRRSGMLLFNFTANRSKKPVPVKVGVSHDDISGIPHTVVREIPVPDGQYYSSLAIRKAILLVQYTDFVKKYMKERNVEKTEKKVQKEFLEFFAMFNREAREVGDETLVSTELKQLTDIATGDGIDVKAILDSKPNSKKRHREEEDEKTPDLDDVLSKMTVEQLKDELGKRGARNTGRKALMVARLKKLMEKERAESSSSSAPPAKKQKLVSEEESKTFRCPITLELMVDPVIAGDGHTYERKAIEEWLANHSLSPITNIALPHKNLTPNVALRSLIIAYRKEHEKAAKKKDPPKKRKTAPKKRKGGK